MNSKTKLLLSIFFIFIFPHAAHLYSQDIGKYAILIFGGKTDPKKGGSDEELYVQFEMAEMYKALLEHNDFENSDIIFII